MLETEVVKGGKIKFDATINLGHILTFIGFVSIGVAMYQKVDTRIVILEENRKTQEVRDLNQDRIMDNSMREIRDTVTEIKKSVERLSDKIDRISR